MQSLPLARSRPDLARTRRPHSGAPAHSQTKRTDVVRGSRGVVSYPRAPSRRVAFRNSFVKCCRARSPQTAEYQYVARLPRGCAIWFAFRSGPIAESELPPQRDVLCALLADQGARRSLLANSANALTFRLQKNCRYPVDKLWIVRQVILIMLKLQ